jgi:hypothetical protein
MEELDGVKQGVWPRRMLIQGKTPYPIASFRTFTSYE